MSLKKIYSVAFLFLICCVSLNAQANSEKWNGYERINFSVEGKACFITLPLNPAPGRPWVWRTSFPDFHSEIDLEVLRNGWSIGYVECLDMLGSDSSLDLMDKFYDLVTKEYKLNSRPALEAVSRGGLHAYRYAARHPKRIACIYGDTPVMDLKSWPLGNGSAKNELQDALRFYNFKDISELRAYKGNPIDVLLPIAEAGIPIRHVISLNDSIVPPLQNTFEAERRLQKLGHTMELVLVQEGTKESGGHHFILPKVFESARFIMKNSYVLPKENEYFSLRDGLGNSYQKFVTGKTGCVAFMGGSITYNPGWRDKIIKYLQDRFPQTKFEFISSGIPSLGSVPHAFRLEQDILAKGKIDLLFVEAAVNDHNYDGLPDSAELALRGMEGIVRHVRMFNPLTDIIILHFVHDQHLKTWEKGDVPYTISMHEKTAEKYGCPSLNLSLEVYERIKAGEFTWEKDFRDLHPSPYGQQLYSNSITRMLDAAFSITSDIIKTHSLPPPIDELSYYNGRFGSLNKVRIIKGFTLEPKWKPEDGKETREGYVDVPALTSLEQGAEFEFEFEGRGIGLMITSGPDAGTIAFSIDGRPEKRISTVTQWSKYLHLPWALMLEDKLNAGSHLVRVRIIDNALRVFHFLEN